MMLVVGIEDRGGADLLVTAIVLILIDLVVASGRRYCASGRFVEHLRAHKDCLP